MILEIGIHVINELYVYVCMYYISKKKLILLGLKIFRLVAIFMPF